MNTTHSLKIDLDILLETDIHTVWTFNNGHSSAPVFIFPKEYELPVQVLLSTVHQMAVRQ